MLPDIPTRSSDCEIIHDGGSLSPSMIVTTSGVVRVKQGQLQQEYLNI
jgi:hypothetical protein